MSVDTHNPTAEVQNVPEAKKTAEVTQDSKKNVEYPTVQERLGSIEKLRTTLESRISTARQADESIKVIEDEITQYAKTVMENFAGPRLDALRDLVADDTTTFEKQLSAYNTILQTIDTTTRKTLENMTSQIREKADEVNRLANATKSEIEELKYHTPNNDTSNELTESELDIIADAWKTIDDTQQSLNQEVNHGNFKEKATTSYAHEIVKRTYTESGLLNTLDEAKKIMGWDEDAQ